MINKKHSIICIVTILAVLSITTLWTTPVLADDQTPPPTDTPTVTDAGDSSSTGNTTDQPTEADPTLSSSALEAIPQNDSSTDAAASPSNPPASDSPLEQVPDGTQVILLDETGNAVPLASEDAAQIVASGDPIWCPAGVAPKANTGGCTNSFSLFNGGLLTALSGKATGGTIWIASGYDSTLESGSITLNGSLGTTANFPLTIQGGWNGTDISKTIIGTSTFNVPLIINWNADVTLNDLIITGVSGPASTALTITTPKNINVSRVQVNTNNGNGADLNNTTGTAKVTIINSQFNSNFVGNGLKVQSKGTITLTDITASKNGGDGADLFNNVIGSAAGITLTGSNIFSQNGSKGLDARSFGAIAISNLINNLNGDWGAKLDNSGALTAQTITLSGSSNQFKYNGSGLYIKSNGIITLSSITSDNNLSGQGADISNNQPGYSASIVISGTNSFNNNFTTGLDLHSNGIVTINNLTASNNGADGASLDNTDAATPKGITLTGSNSFNGNIGNGLDLRSNGVILTNNITAKDNGQHGANLQNDSSGAVGSITITGINGFNNNGWSGLVVNSKGSIALNNVTANDNGQSHTDPTVGAPYYFYGYGVSIFNASNPAAPQNVSIIGTNAFNNNWLSGLEAHSFGVIAVNNLTASDNGVGNFDLSGYGVILDNCLETGTPNLCAAITAKAINITGTNTFNNNHDSGLEVRSLGAITTNNLTAKNNEKGQGALLENDYTNGTAAITLNGNNYFVNNFYDGLYGTSFGAITLNNITSTGNGIGAAGAYGVYLNNAGSGTAASVTLKGVNYLDSNNAGGLYIHTKGAITLAAVTANNSVLGTGATLDNTFGGTPQNVTISGINNFNGNYGNGIDITTEGLITIRNITANDNGWGLSGGSGALLNNSGAATPKTITLTGTNTFSGNGTDGLNISTKGIITVALVEASNNGGNGAILDNNLSGALGGVTVLGKGCTFNNNNGYGCLNDNGGNGLDITSKGIITLTMMNVQNNLGHGASLDNTSGTGGIILNITPGFDSANQFSGNGTYGLQALTHGVIIATNLRAGYNTTYGALLDNSNSSAPMVITLSGFSNLFTNNGGSGLEAYSKGAITISALTSKNNTGYGIILDNTDTGPASPQNVTLTGANYFGNNGDTGLQINSYGLIALNNITANSNGTASVVGQGYGVYLKNYWDVSEAPFHPTTIISKPITLTGINIFNGNFDDGLRAITKGAFASNQITASYNGGDGAYLKNQSGAGSNGGITLTGYNNFEGNGLLGLEAYSHGAITINNLSANSNTGGAITNGNGTFNVAGVYLVNKSLTTTPVKVTLTGTSSFLDNGNNIAHTGTGLMVYSDGAITLNNITANGNSQNGVILNNDYYSAAPATITLTGINIFNDNYEDGFYFSSKGIVNVTKIRADKNGHDGVNGATVAGLTLTCGSMTGNGNYGWNLTSTAGTIKLIGVFGIGNTTDNLTSGTTVITRTCALP